MKNNKFKRSVISTALGVLSLLILSGCSKTENENQKQRSINNATSTFSENNITLYACEPYEKEKIAMLGYYYRDEFYNLAVYEIDKSENKILYAAINNPKVAVVGTYNGEDGYDFIVLADTGDEVYQTADCYIDYNVQHRLVETFGDLSTFTNDQITKIELAEKEEILSRNN